MIKSFSFWMIIAGASALFLAGLGARDLWNPDEPRYAQVAREMLESSDWVVMHINGAEYPDKPPIYFWAQGIISKFTGDVDEFTARLPAALSGIGVIALSMIIAARMFGKTTAALTGLILLTTYTFVGQSRYVHMDMPLTLVMLGMFYIISNAAFGKSPPNPKSWLPFFALGAAGTLIKGPIGLFVPVFAGFAYLTLRRVGRSEKRKLLTALLIIGAIAGILISGMKGMALVIVPGVIVLFLTGGPGRALNRWTGFGAILFVLILGAWLVPACFKGSKAFVDEILFIQNIGRYSEGFSHVRPFYYFFHSFPLLFLPWVAFLPMGFIETIRSGRNSESEKQKGLMLIAWVAATFIFFSISSSKRGIYLLPLFPGAAIITARYFERLFSGDRREHFAVKPAKYIFIIYACCLVLVGIAMAVGPYVVGDLESEFAGEVVTVLKSHTMLLIALCAINTLICAYIVINATRRQWRAAFGGMCVSLLISFCLVEFFVLPQIMNPFKSAREFSREVCLKTGDAEVAWFGNVHEGVLYYGRMRLLELRKPEDMVEFMGDGMKERFCLMTDKRAKAFLSKDRNFFEKNRMHSILTGRVGSKRFILFTNTNPQPPDGHDAPPETG